MNNHSLCTALQIFTNCYNIDDIIQQHIYDFFSLSLSLSLSLHHQITNITIVGSLLNVQIACETHMNV